MMRNKTGIVFSLIFVISAFFIISCGGGDKQAEQKQSASGTQMSTSGAQQSGLESGDAAKGQTLYIQNCSACHGQDGTGVKGVGKDLVHSEFVAELSNQEFLQYVKQGRTVDDPRNTTGIPMPPKGGNPALTDQQILHIIAYVRQINQVEKK